MVATLNNGAQKLTQLVEECPVAIEINDIAYAVMLCTPEHLDQFVIGFLLTEQVIAHNHDVHEILFETHTTPNSPIVSVIAKVTVANRCAKNLLAKQRRLKGATGCGVCGKTSLQEALPSMPTSTPQHVATTPSWFDTNYSTLLTLRRDLPQHQIIAKQSGALHAAFWLDEQGKVVFCLEDIGRHNALDKLIGQLLMARIDPSSGAVLMTSRCSVELVQKVIVAQIPTLLSLSSPSQTAVNLARQHQLSLVHLPKYDAPIQYSPNKNTEEICHVETR